MRKYKLPKIEIARFSAADVVIASESGQQTEKMLTYGAPNAAGKDILSDTVQKYEISYDMAK